MAANFTLAKSIFLSGDELSTLLAELKPAKFAFTVLNALVNVSVNATVKVGMITGFSINSNNNDNTTSLVHSHLHGDANTNASMIAEADVSLVVDFGDSKQVVKLSNIRSNGTLLQNDHGLFIQRCASNPAANVVIPSAEQIVEIRTRIAHGRENHENSAKNSFATWKIVERESGKNNSRRDRGSTDESSTNNNNSNESETLLARFQDRRVAKLQSQLSEQLSSLSQARNEFRSLESEVARLTNELKQANDTRNSNNLGGNNDQQQLQQSNSSGANQAMIMKLATTVSTLTQKCSQLTNQVDDLVSAGSSRFNCEPTVQAVLEAMLK